MSDVDARAAAEAEMAKAQADLAAAEASETIRIGTRSPWETYQLDPESPLLTFDGSDVPVTVAEKLLAAAPSVLIRKDDSASQ